MGDKKAQENAKIKKGAGPLEQEKKEPAKFTLEDYMKKPDTELTKMLPLETEERKITASVMKDADSSPVPNNVKDRRKKQPVNEEKLDATERKNEVKSGRNSKREFREKIEETDEKLSKKLKPENKKTEERARKDDVIEETEDRYDKNLDLESENASRCSKNSSFADLSQDLTEKNTKKTYQYLLKDKKNLDSRSGSAYSNSSNVSKNSSRNSYRNRNDLSPSFKETSHQVKSKEKSRSKKKLAKTAEKNEPKLESSRKNSDENLLSVENPLENLVENSIESPIESLIETVTLKYNEISNYSAEIAVQTDIIETESRHLDKIRKHEMLIKAQSKELESLRRQLHEKQLEIKKLQFEKEENLKEISLMQERYIKNSEDIRNLIQNSNAKDIVINELREKIVVGSNKDFSSSPNKYSVSDAEFWKLEELEEQKPEKISLKEITKNKGLWINHMEEKSVFIDLNEKLKSRVFDSPFLSKKNELQKLPNARNKNVRRSLEPIGHSVHK